MCWPASAAGRWAASAFSPCADLVRVSTRCRRCDRRRQVGRPARMSGTSYWPLEGGLCTPPAVEKFLYLGEEAFALRVAVGVLVAFGFEFLQQLALPPGEVLRRLDGDLDEHVATLRRAQRREALAAQAELIAGLGAGRDLHLCARAVDDRHLDIAAKSRERHAQRHANQDVRAVALEQRVRPDANMHIEIARRSTLPASLAFAREADELAILNPRRNRHLKRALALDGAGTVADAARVAHHAPGAAAGRTGPLDQEETLLRAHLAGALARLARVIASVLVFRPCSGARLADDARLYPERGLDAGERFGQVDLDSLPDIGAGPRAPAAPPSAHELAEHLIEDVAEAARRLESTLEAEAAGAARATLLERRMAETIIGRALLFVLQHVVGLAHFLEASLGLLVAGIAVGMVLHRELAVRLLEIFAARVSRDPQGRIIILLRHLSPFLRRR